MQKYAHDQIDLKEKIVDKLIWLASSIVSNYEEMKEIIQSLDILSLVM